MKKEYETMTIEIIRFSDEGVHMDIFISSPTLDEDEFGDELWNEFGE